MLNVTRLLACACSLAVVALFVFVQFGMALLCLGWRSHWRHIVVGYGILYCICSLKFKRWYKQQINIIWKNFSFKAFVCELWHDLLTLIGIAGDLDFCGKAWVVCLAACTFNLYNRIAQYVQRNSVRKLSYLHAFIAITPSWLHLWLINY